MAEQLTVYRPGDRFATMSRGGTARIWQVQDDGLAEITEGWWSHPRRCLAYWGQVSSRCVRPEGHDGDHHFQGVSEGVSDG